MKKEFELSPKDWVLVRDTDDNLWKLDIFSHLVEHSLAKYVCVGSWYKQCIPYEGNEHLLGHSDPYVEPYKPKDGDFVYVELKNGSKYIFIKNKGEELSGKYISLNVCYGFLSNDCPKCCEDSDIILIRPATDDEKSQLLSKLHKTGKDWNAEKKSIVNYSAPFSPKVGDILYVRAGYEHLLIYAGIQDDGCMAYADLVGGHLSIYNLDSGKPVCALCVDDIKEHRMATPEEVERILSCMERNGKKWNAESKKVVPVEPPYEPKEGDFVVFRPDGRELIGILKRSRTDDYPYSDFHAYAELSPSSSEVRLDATFGGIFNFRPAYQVEKESFIGKLWKAHRRWDAEKHAVTYCDDCSEIKRGGIYEVWHDGKMDLALVKELSDDGYLSVFFSYNPEKQISVDVFWDGVWTSFDKLVEVREGDARIAIFYKFMHETGCFYDKKSGRFYDYRKQYVNGEICWFLSYQPDLNKFVTNRFKLSYCLRSFLKIANGNVFRTEDLANERAAELNQLLKK